MEPRRKPYPSDEEWAFVALYLTLLPLDAKQRQHDLREAFNGLRFTVRTGMQCRMMPNNLHPWCTVYQQKLAKHPLCSKKPVGVIQELYALLIAHYAVRHTMHETAL